MSRSVERIWAADGPAAWALTPLSWLFGIVVAIKNALYDRGILSARSLGAPAISVGNLSVGGSGKTPVSAWIAAELQRRGARPAILLRGYGSDEVQVHRLLNPGIPVVANPDRVEGAKGARAQGANVLVLDDAFQHRRAARDADVVLVPAEQASLTRLLPAGPLREGRSSLRRAALTIVTRKSASKADAEAAAAAWSGYAGAPPTAIVVLKPGMLRDARALAGGTPEPDRPLDSMSGKKLLAVSGIGSPEAFERQLGAGGAAAPGIAFGDHHAYTAAEVEMVLAKAASLDAIAVCTLKDAVKLAPLWPRQGPPLWYLSQAVEVERGAETLSAILDRLVAATKG